MIGPIQITMMTTQHQKQLHAGQRLINGLWEYGVLAQRGITN